MARLHSYIRPSINILPGFSGKKANQNFHGIFPSTKIIKLRAIKGNEKSPWRVLTTSQIIQTKKLKATHTKNNFKKIVHNPNSNNSDKNGDSDCCAECKEYCYVTKEECAWIKCSFCEKWLHENYTISSQTCLDCGRNNRSKNLKIPKKSTKK